MNTVSDPFRPLYHVAPATGWINDPNGLVYFKGKWHLFYQYYNPAEIDGMQWGHAVSPDLVHWQHLPPAIRPDALGQIWSGSAVVDHHDTSGLFDGNAGLICYFTYWDKSDRRQSQGMAYSADGITFKTWGANPIIAQLRYLPGQPDDKEFRDPKVFWHEPSGRWVMAVAGGKLRIFSSIDLLHWTLESVSDTIETECPDLFELPLDGDPSNTRWVLSLGGRTYLVGSFDGKQFIPEDEAIVMSSGPDFYATQSWSDAPDGRRVIVSWIFGWGYGCKLDGSGITAVFPTEPRAGGCMTTPYELTLISTPAGMRLKMLPVPEIDSLRIELPGPQDVQLRDGVMHHLSAHTHALDLTFAIGQCTATRVGVRIPAGKGLWIAAGYDFGSKRLFIDRRNSGVNYAENYPGDYLSEECATPAGVALRILIDNCSVELFTADGLHHMSAFIMPDPASEGVDLFCDGGQARVARLRVHALADGRGTGSAGCGAKCNGCPAS